MAKMIVSSGALLRQIQELDLLSFRDRKLSVIDGKFKIEGMAYSIDVEHNENIEIEYHNSKLRALQSLVRSIPEQPLTIKFDSHIEIEGVSL